MKPLCPNSFVETHTQFVSSSTTPVLILHIPLFLCQVEVVHDDIMYQQLSTHDKRTDTGRQSCCQKRNVDTQKQFSSLKLKGYLSLCTLFIKVFSYYNHECKVKAKPIHSENEAITKRRAPMSLNHFNL